MKATETAPGATQSAEDPSRILPGGGCACTGLTDWRQCRCEWGILVEELLRFGYLTGPTEAAQKIGGFGQRLIVVTAMRRREIMRAAAQRWEGTATAFAELYGVTRGQLSGMGIKINSRY